MVRELVYIFGALWLLNPLWHACSMPYDQLPKLGTAFFKVAHYLPRTSHLCAVRIREYTAADLDALQRLHARQGLGYAFPELSHPLFLTKLVVDHHSTTQGDAARSAGIVMAALLHLTAEAYLLVDPDAGTPLERWQWLLALHEAVRADARRRGLDDVQAFVPPQVERAFGRRLRRLGWRRDPWAPYCIAIRES